LTGISDSATIRELAALVSGHTGMQTPPRKSGILAGRHKEEGSMATVQREIEIARNQKVVWHAVRDVGQIHRRLVPGFVVDCRLEGNSRILRFGNGMVIRELIVSVDDETCRHAWSARGEPFTHHNASLQVLAEGEALSRLVWIADLLPDEMRTTVGEMMSQGLEIMKRTLEGA